MASNLTMPVQSWKGIVGVMVLYGCTLCFNGTEVGGGQILMVGLVVILGVLVWVVIELDQVVEALLQ